MADTGLDQTWPGTAGDAGAGQEINWWVEAFKDEMWHLAQQKSSKLRGKVRTRSITGDATYAERLAASDPVEKATRHTTTPLLDLSHSRRKITMTDWLWSDLVDAEDKRRMLVDPVSAYTTNAGMSMGRKWDDLIIAAAVGSSYDGTGTEVVFDTTNQQVAAGTTGMTIAKLTEAKYILDSNDVDQMGRCIVISPQELSQLLNTTEITSADYNTVRALVKGEINTFMGFEFIVSTRLTDDATNRNCFAFQKDAMLLAVNKDTEIRRDERPDLSYALQVFARFTANAGRIDDAGVVSILTALAPA
jgi:hypothetical protein